MRRIEQASSAQNVRSGKEPGSCDDSKIVEGEALSIRALQSRRHTQTRRPAYQDGTRVMPKSLFQRMSQQVQDLIRSAVAVRSATLSRYLTAMCVAVGAAAPAMAQHQFPGDIDYTIPQNPYAIPDYSGSLNAQPARGVGGFGVMGRAGHNVGDTVGRNGSVSFMDLQPYSFNGNSMLFSDLRLYVNNYGKWGGNAGLGVRHFFPAHNTVLGSTFYYDHDETRGVTFEQFTIASELLTEFVDFRANVYIPFGDRQQVTGVRFEPGTQMFVDATNSSGDVQGSNIVYQTRTYSSAALDGVDATLTTPLVGEFAEKFNLEATAGGYFYHARDFDLQDVAGFKLRLDGDFMDELTHLSLEVTSDNVFNTNVVFGASVNYWGHLEKQPRLGKSQYDRMASWVRRSRTVSTLDSSALDAPQLAINPNTDLPYLVYHVNNDPANPGDNFPAPLGNGSLAMPYQYMQEAIDASPFADIVFVHANSVFDGLVDGNANATAVLREDVLVLGEGVPLTIPVVGIAGEIDLPTVSTGPTTRPVIQNVTGPAITMASNSRFAGFAIQDYADGPAILADGISGAELNELIIDGSTGALGTGIEVNDSTGTFILENISINDTSADAFVVTGGNAAISFSGTNTITNSSGLSVFIEDASGSVNMRGVTIMDDGGEGVLVTGTTPTSSTANITFDQVTLSNTNTALNGAFQIENHAGGVTVLNDMTINSPGTGGISIENLQSTGSVVFQGAVGINNRNERGVYFLDFAEGPNPLNPTMTRAGSVTFQNNLVINGLGTGAATNPLPAIDMETSSGTVTFEDIVINQSLSTGIDISNLADTGTSTGRFVVNGLATINGVADDSINIESVAKANFQTIMTDVAITNRGAIGVDVFDSASTTRFLGTTTISNGLGVLSPAIVVEANTGNTAFNVADVTEALGTFGVLVIDNINPQDNVASNVSFGTLNVEFTGFAATTGESAVFFDNNDDVGVGSGEIESVDARGVTVTNNSLHNITFQSVSAENDDYGILVADSVGRFTVTGLSNVSGSGGTITGMTVAGADFSNTQVVNLGYVELEGNQLGVRGDTIIIEGAGISPEVVLEGLDISDSNEEAVRMINVSDFMLIDSVLNNNGFATGENQVDFLATIDEIDIDGDDDDDPVVYNVDIINNDISDGAAILGSDMISIRTGPGIGDGAQLNLSVLNNGVPGSLVALNSFSSNRTANMAALGIVWTGPSDIVIDSNTFIANNGGGVGMILDGVANVSYTNNDMSVSQDGAFGLDLTFEEATDLVISDNSVFDADGNVVAGSGFLMSGNNATAMLLNFMSGNNNVTIENNLVNMTGFDSTGIEFERIFSPSTVTINNNAIFLVTDFDTAREEGIIFSDVRGVINLNGSVDNAIPLGTFLPFYIDFFIPAGTSNGQIIVNGSARP